MLNRHCCCRRCRCQLSLWLLCCGFTNIYEGTYQCPQCSKLNNYEVWNSWIKYWEDYQTIYSKILKKNHKIKRQKRKKLLKIYKKIIDYMFAYKYFDLPILFRLLIILLFCFPNFPYLFTTQYKMFFKPKLWPYKHFSFLIFHTFFFLLFIYQKFVNFCWHSLLL